VLGGLVLSFAGCCAIAAALATATTTPAGTTTGAVTAYAAVRSRKVRKGCKYFNATLLYRSN
jgi:hypothetical protein